MHLSAVRLLRLATWSTPGAATLNQYIDILSQAFERSKAVTKIKITQDQDHRWRYDELARDRLDAFANFMGVVNDLFVVLVRFAMLSTMASGGLDQVFGMLL